MARKLLKMGTSHHVLYRRNMLTDSLNDGDLYNSKGEVIEVVDRKAGWRSFRSLKRQSLELDMKSKLRSITAKTGDRVVLTCPR